jgi:hypothetical protein
MSRFKGILDVAKGREPEPGPVAPTTTNTPPALPATGTSTRKPGRPPGKRSDPGFVQVTAYIPADLHHNIKLALLQERRGREFSELVGELLTGWLGSRS